MLETMGLKLDGLSMPVREAFLRSEEGSRNCAAGGNRLGKKSEERLRSVDAFLRASDPIEEGVADAVPAARLQCGV